MFERLVKIFTFVHAQKDSYFTGMIALKLEKVCKRYGSFTALDEVSFEVEHGEIVGLLGTNGAGKTTTMRIITTYLPPSAGNVEVCGYSLATDAEKIRENVGYMPENPPLYRDMKTCDFLRFVCELKKIPSKEIPAALDFVREKCGLSPVWKEFLFALSKGYRQRVGLASAVVAKPQLIILDEPTIGLAPEQIIHIRRFIRELGGSHTVLLSTHILHEAEMLCDRIIIVNRGRIVANDSPANLAAHMHRVRMFHVKLSASQEEVCSALEKLAGIVHVEKTERNGCLVETDDPTHFAALIDPLLREKNWHIVELSPVEANLETIFLDIVRPGANADGHFC